MSWYKLLYDNLFVTQGEMLPNPSDYKPSLIVLTAQNWLLRLSADCGEILEKVYLAGSCCKFRY